MFFYVSYNNFIIWRMGGWMRFVLFSVSLILTMITFTIFGSISGLLSEPDKFGLSYAVILIIGIVGTMFCYFSAKAYMGWSLNLIPINTSDDDKLDEINHNVKRLALSAGIRPPEMYSFESEKPNLIMVGSNPNKSIIAFSSKMLETFSVEEISGAMAPLIAGTANGTLRTKLLLISLMNSFGVGIGQWINDKLKKTSAKYVGEVIYFIIFTAALIAFNLPTYIIFRIYSRKSTFKNDILAMDITSTQEIISGLSRLGTKCCDIGKSSQYISLMGKQKDKDNFLNPFGTIPVRIDSLMREKLVRNKVAHNHKM